VSGRLVSDRTVEADRITAGECSDMKGDKAQTSPERQTPPVTKRRTHLKKELRTLNSKLLGEKRYH
jgi:hypothetical protein